MHESSRGQLTVFFGAAFLATGFLAGAFSFFGATALVVFSFFGAAAFLVAGAAFLAVVAFGAAFYVHISLECEIFQMCTDLGGGGLLGGWLSSTSLGSRLGSWSWLGCWAGLDLGCKLDGTGRTLWLAELALLDTRRDSLVEEGRKGGRVGGVVGLDVLLESGAARVARVSMMRVALF